MYSVLKKINTSLCHISEICTLVNGHSSCPSGSCYTRTPGDMCCAVHLNLLFGLIGTMS